MDNHSLRSPERWRPSRVCSHRSTIWREDSVSCSLLSQSSRTPSRPSRRSLMLEEWERNEQPLTKWIESKCTRNWYEPPCVIVIINFATYTRLRFIFKIHFKNLRILMIRNSCFHFECSRTLTSISLIIRSISLAFLRACDSKFIWFSYFIKQIFYEVLILMESSITGDQFNHGIIYDEYWLTYNSSKNTQNKSRKTHTWLPYNIGRSHYWHDQCIYAGGWYSKSFMISCEYEICLI